MSLSHLIRYVPKEVFLSATISLDVNYTQPPTLLRGHPADPPKPDETRSLEELRETTLKLLDFDQVRQRLADHTTFYEARKLALEIQPSFDPGHIETLQRETADAKALLEEVGDLTLQSDTDTSEAVTRAALGGVLTGNELLAVAESLEVHRRARSSVRRAADCAPIMAELADIIPDLREIQRQVRSKITRRGEVSENATPSLRALRSQVRQAYERVNESLQNFMQSSTVRESLQDPIIAIRGDRLVVPVKAERRHRISGIVHDASNTGATVFVEPFTTVELCNEWRELALEEEREVLRVLRDLSSLVGAVADDIRLANRITAKMDFALARARYALRLHAVMPKPTGDAQNLRLVNIRHPLLGTDAIPLTVEIGPGWSALVITGPNTGGKTVAMKNVGLAALMHQSGLQIPAEEGSVLPIFEGVFADIGDSQSIADSISTFGSHIRRVISILRHAGPRSLALLDELGTSTDPEEGSALAKAIIAHLARKKAITIVTTHHRNVAAFAEASDDMMNASFQLDARTLEPTYRMTIGTPGRSYAMAVAERLGLPKPILDDSRDLMEPQHLLFEDWLNELQRERLQLQTNIEDASRMRSEAESLRRQLEDQVEYMVEHRDAMLDSARGAIMERFRQINRRLESAEASLRWATPEPAGATAAPTRGRIERIRRDLAAAELPTPAPVRRRRAPDRPLAVGDTVFIRGMNLQGRIIAISENGEEAEVSIGRVRVNVDLHRLSRVEETEEQDADVEPDAVKTDLAAPLESLELDLRGLRVDDAQVKLDEFLDHAMRDGLSKLRVIHGRGTGALRNVVREHLRRHRAVRNFGPEPRERGGNGATWVEMA